MKNDERGILMINIKEGDSLTIGNDILITVVKIQRNYDARLCIKAPKSVRIERKPQCKSTKHIASAT